MHQISRLAHSSTHSRPLFTQAYIISLFCYRFLKSKIFFWEEILSPGHNKKEFRFLSVSFPTENGTAWVSARGHALGILAPKKKEEREKKEIWTRRTPVVTSLPTPERPTHITRNGTKRSSVKYQILVGNHLTDCLLLCASTAFEFKQNLYSGIELRIRYSNLSWYYIIPDIWDWLLDIKNCLPFNGVLMDCFCL